MKSIYRILVLPALGAGLALMLSGTPAKAADYPSVHNLKPFSAEANYMSLPGYLRYMVYERDGVWLSREEAVSIVNQQIATGQ